MSMVYRWRPAGSSVSTDLGNQVIRLGDIQGFKQSGILGQADVITLTFDNPGDALNLTGMRPFWVVENTAPANNQVIWYGYIQARTYKRDANRSMITGADNTITADIVDLNAALAWAMITQASGKRPAETATARVNWLLGLSNCPVADYGKVTAPTLNMDACDYRGQFMSDVLGDVVAQSGYNFFAYLDESHNAGGLWLNDPNAGTDTSTLRISNVLSEIDNVTTFYPYPDAELRRSPERVASGVWLPYKTGAVYKTNATTRSNFVNVDRSAPMANVATKTKATAAANRFLADNDEEDDVITVTIRVPAASVNLARVGQTIAVHFSHLPGYSATYVSMYIMDRNVAQPVEDDTNYVITYTLSKGPPAAPAIPTLVQHKSENGGTGIFAITLDQPPAPGNLLLMVSNDRLAPGGTPALPTDYTWTNIAYGVFAGDADGVRIMYRIVQPGDGQSYEPAAAFVSTVMIAEFTAPASMAIDGLVTTSGGAGAIPPTVGTMTINLSPTVGVTELCIAVFVSTNHNLPADYDLVPGLSAGWHVLDMGQAAPGGPYSPIVNYNHIITGGPAHPNIGWAYFAGTTTSSMVETMTYTPGYNGINDSYWTTWGFGVGPYT